MSCSSWLINSEGGFFKAHLLFPKEYPQKPPKMKFISEMWHPNSMCDIIWYLFYSMYF